MYIVQRYADVFPTQAASDSTIFLIFTQITYILLFAYSHSRRKVFKN